MTTWETLAAAEVEMGVGDRTDVDLVEVKEIIKSKHSSAVKEMCSRVILHEEWKDGEGYKHNIP